MNVLSAEVQSGHRLSTSQSNTQDKSAGKNRSNTLHGDSSIKANDDQLNRINFFLKNIGTPKSCLEIFVAIGTMYPFVQLNSTEKSTKIQYLCVAGNICIVLNSTDELKILDSPSASPDKRVSIHLCFQRKVNFKHKFLNDLFPGKNLNRAFRIRVSRLIDLKTSDYLLVVNGDQFNAEIKSVAKGSYIESSSYLAKKEKSTFIDAYRQKQDEVATAAFAEKSLASG
jgi:hypothetical protein